MKKLCLILLICALAVTLCACGSFSPPIMLPDSPIAGDDPNAQPPAVEEEDDDVFSVSLECNGHPFYPSQTLYAQWTGKEGTYIAEFDPLGVAKISGLDGEYRVTLSALPAGYTYDPNKYTVDNSAMDVTIEILVIEAEIDRIDTTLYECQTISRVGTYRATFASKNHTIYLEYTPWSEGKYTIESWADTTANSINPILVVYGGNSEFKFNPRTINSGGSSSTFTKNFKYEVQLTRNEVGNLWTLELSADAIDNQYPVTVDFTITRTGEMEEPDSQYRRVPPTGPFNIGEGRDEPIGTFTYIYGDDKILNEDNVIFNEEDGYYHVYDPATKTMGGLLYVKINADSEILTTSSGQGIMDDSIPLRFYGLDYYDFVAYYDYCCNSDGAHPVNKELKDFLFDFALYLKFFYDGYGSAEKQGFYSGEEDQWLFGCGYYVLT